MKCRLGDEVMTPLGAVAVVLEVRSFHESMALLSEDEAELMARDLMARFGPTAPKDWQQVLVRQRGALKWFQNSELSPAEMNNDRG